MFENSNPVSLEDIRKANYKCDNDCKSCDCKSENSIILQNNISLQEIDKAYREQEPEFDIPFKKSNNKNPDVILMDNNKEKDISKDNVEIYTYDDIDTNKKNKKIITQDLSSNLDDNEKNLNKENDICLVGINNSNNLLDDSEDINLSNNPDFHINGDNNKIIDDNSFNLRETNLNIENDGIYINNAEKINLNNNKKEFFISQTNSLNENLINKNDSLINKENSLNQNLLENFNIQNINSENINSLTIEHFKNLINNLTIKNVSFDTSFNDNLNKFLAQILFNQLNSVEIKDFIKWCIQNNPNYQLLLNNIIKSFIKEIILA